MVSLTLSVFEHRVLRRIFRSKREEVEGGWSRITFSTSTWRRSADLLVWIHLVNSEDQWN